MQNYANKWDDLRKNACQVLETEYKALHGRPHYSPLLFLNDSPTSRERALAAEVHKLARDGSPQTALCLSGGGIRSATFSLGVLQALAKSGWLDKFHYLSTVSGGGYIGSWLSRWIHDAGGGLAAVRSELATDGGAGHAEPAQVSRLRAYSNYLSPAWGFSTDFLTLVSIFARNLLLVWAVLVPLIASLLMLPRLHLAGIWQKNMDIGWIIAGFGLGMFLVVVGIAYIASDLPESPTQGTTPATQTLAPAATIAPADRFGPACFMPIFFGSILLSCAWAWFSIRPRDIWPWDQQLWVWMVAGACFGAVAHLIGAAAGKSWRRMRNIAPRPVSKLGFVLVALSGAAAGALLTGAAWTLSDVSLDSAGNRLLYSTLSQPILLGTIWLGTFAYALLTGHRFSTEDDREWWARSGAWWLFGSLGWVAACIIVFYIPQWLLAAPLDTSLLDPAKIGIGGGFAGLLAGLIGFWSENGAELKERGKNLIATTGRKFLDLLALAFILALLLTICSLTSKGLYCLEDMTACNPTKDTKAYQRKLDDESAYEQLIVNPAVQKRLLGEWDIRKNIIDGATVNSRLMENPQVRRLVTRPDFTSFDHPKGYDLLSSPEGTAILLAEPAVHNAMKSDLAESEMIRHQLTSDSPVSGDVNRIMGGWARYRWVLMNATESNLAWVFSMLLAVGIACSWFTGVNTFSLHGMYGNRLVRAYLGAPRTARNPHWFTRFDQHDNIALNDLIRSGGSHRLLHIINGTLNLAQSTEAHLDWQQRKAAPFTFSPLHCGSPIAGYQPTGSYAGGMTLGRAMTISGAAATPNMGYNTSPLVAFAMTFFNIRLGWWLPNPGAIGEPSWGEKEPQWGFLHLVGEALARTTDSTRHVYVSDGGHFDNLGLYEIVRRRCHGIVVVDATCDPEYEFGDLESTLRKIRVDLGITIEFPGGLPTPNLVRQTKRHFSVGRIRYSDVDGEVPDGRIVYIKPCLDGDEPLDVTRYAAASGDRRDAFPHQSTSDQFFDESQFESYRMLGYRSASQRFPDAAVWPQPDPPRNARLKPVGGRATVPAATASAAIQRQPTEPQRGIGSLLADAVNSIGVPASVATALTVGGVFGVTVGPLVLKADPIELKPGSEIGLNDESKKLLRDGISVGSPQVAELGQLRDALNELRTAIAGAQAGSVAGSATQTAADQAGRAGLAPVVKDLNDAIRSATDPRLTTLVTRLDDASKALDGFTGRLAKWQPGAGIPLPKPDLDPIVREIRDLKAELGKITERLRPAAISKGTNSPTLADALQGINERLAKLTEIHDDLMVIGNRVEGIGPRKNIRGSGGGGAP